MGERSRRYARRPAAFALTFALVAGLAGAAAWAIMGLASSGASPL